MIFLISLINVGGLCSFRVMIYNECTYLNRPEGLDYEILLAEENLRDDPYRK